ncbi:hypothetical protein ACR8E0_22270 [Salmonella enterica subsp. enterica serovar Paratyphi A]|uniref:hypothetical protein n=1 Tax=Enterobacteriaceae TaxID=543 RepID=UPI00307ACB9A
MDSKSEGKYTGIGDKADLDNHSNQCNPNNKEYAGHKSEFGGTKADADNHANQCNPNNPSYKGGK